MSEWKYDETFVIVYQYTDTKEFVIIPVVKNEEDYVLTILAQTHPRQKLRNLFKVNYKGETIPFKELKLSPKLTQKIKELTGK